MNPQKLLSEFTDEELAREEKKRKRSIVAYQVITALMVGVAIYTTVNEGFSFFTIFPLFFIPIFSVKKSDYNIIQSEIKLRKSL